MPTSDETYFHEFLKEKQIEYKVSISGQNGAKSWGNLLIAKNKTRQQH